MKTFILIAMFANSIELTSSKSQAFNNQILRYIASRLTTSECTKLEEHLTNGDSGDSFKDLCAEFLEKWITSERESSDAKSSEKSANKLMSGLTWIGRSDVREDVNEKLLEDKTDEANKDSLLSFESLKDADYGFKKTPIDSKDEMMDWLHRINSNDAPKGSTNTEILLSVLLIILIILMSVVLLLLLLSICMPEAFADVKNASFKSLNIK